ncbi:hypothetical protein [Escherichia coli]|nr:hypothetical protein [Escherichia coli]
MKNKIIPVKTGYLPHQHPGIFRWLLLTSEQHLLVADNYIIPAPW